ncbi:MAG TPA: PspC domain-containing protein [Candidatus Angelobacter sp.]|nr:PspC domain-containing protein [Candidatus Angelobacter sp.]
MRPRQGRKVAGVCAGIAEYLDLDPTLIRIVWLMCLLAGGVGLLGYLVAWIVVPEEPFTPVAPAPVLPPHKIEN